MNNQSQFTQHGFNSDARDQNVLSEYIQSLDAESITQLSKPNSEVRQLMESHLNGILGNLPPQHFDVSITTSRENLGQLLAAAMLNGYFLHSASQRMNLEHSLPTSLHHQDQSSEAKDNH
ncbi:hypothetical protein M595_2672 [Lyngbya aestuarii BL J]|uniref:DUF760 domain-containing protein n=1 Tax=Lyngbya aestuarii BL J TaxID=1348334 RepID=U7QLQ4_9CYAN|nr:DUF760 domain-containing protein [Lyngbya aestuarii]ERT07356.1 hypothetical protein M595_2672 [Lyngbya aestuarii BL J]